MRKLLAYFNEENKAILTNNTTQDITFIEDDMLAFTINDIIEASQDLHSKVIYHHKLQAIIFHEFDDNGFNANSELLNQHQISCIKIITTPTNKTWTIHKLFNEIEAEHRFYKLKEELKKLLELHPKHRYYQKALDYYDNSSDINDIKKAINKLKK